MDQKQFQCWSKIIIISFVIEAQAIAKISSFLIQILCNLIVSVCAFACDKFLISSQFLAQLKCKFHLNLRIWPFMCIVSFYFLLSILFPIIICSQLQINAQFELRKIVWYVHVFVALYLIIKVFFIFFDVVCFVRRFSMKIACVQQSLCLCKYALNSKWIWIELRSALFCSAAATHSVLFRFIKIHRIQCA